MTTYQAMRSLTEDLLEISRLDTRSERVEPDPYDLADLAAAPSARRGPRRTWSCGPLRVW